MDSDGNRPWSSQNSPASAGGRRTMASEIASTRVGTFAQTAGVAPCEVMTHNDPRCP